MSQTQHQSHELLSFPLQPFPWESYTPSSTLQEISVFDWNIEEEIGFEPLSLQDLETDYDSLPSLVSISSDDYFTNTDTTLNNIMIYTIDKVIEDKDGECECPICYEPIHKEQKIKTNCNHIYCDTCIMTYLDTCYHSSKDPCCALCREVYTLFEIPNPPTFDKMKRKLEDYQPDIDDICNGLDTDHETQLHFVNPRNSRNIPVSFDVESIFEN